VKVLTLWEPWASLVALGYKRVETRCWATRYRGPLAIHAAAKLPPKWLGASRHETEFRDELADCFNARRDSDDRTGLHVDEVIRSLPYGAVLCIVDLVAVRETGEVYDDLDTREHIFGNYEDGRYAWFLEMVEKFENPIPAKGNRLLWNWERPA
jgi:activating signal cointegrator 1